MEKHFTAAPAAVSNELRLCHVRYPLRPTTPLYYCTLLFSPLLYETMCMCRVSILNALLSLWHAPVTVNVSHLHADTAKRVETINRFPIVFFLSSTYFQLVLHVGVGLHRWIKVFVMLQCCAHFLLLFFKISFARRHIVGGCLELLCTEILLLFVLFLIQCRSKRREKRRTDEVLHIESV